MGRLSLQQMDDQQLLLHTIRKAIRRKQRKTGCDEVTVNWKRDRLLDQLEKVLVSSGWMLKDYQLTEHGKRHFTCLLAKLGRQTKTRAPLLVMTGSQHNREISL